MDDLRKIVTPNTARAADAVRVIKPKIAIPMHYGAIIGSLSDAEAFQKQADCKVVILPAEGTQEKSFGPTTNTMEGHGKEAKKKVSRGMSQKLCVNPVCKIKLPIEAKFCDTCGTQQD